MEQTPADLGVHRVRELGLQVGDALLDLGLVLGLDDGLVVDGDEPGQRELVHRVDVLQLDDAEEEDGRVVCHLMLMMVMMMMMVAVMMMLAVKMMMVMI